MIFEYEEDDHGNHVYEGYVDEAYVPTACADGYASVEPTSNEDYQVELSQRRADAVKAYLVNRGVRVDSAVGHGSNDEYGRVVVVTFKK